MVGTKDKQLDGVGKLHTPSKCNSLLFKGYRANPGAVLTFLYNTHLKRHSFSIQIPLEKQHLPGYPEFPITVGEHIRKKRMDFSLLQREVAEIIGVTESSIWNWEHGTEPELQYNRYRVHSMKLYLATDQ